MIPSQLARYQSGAGTVDEDAESDAYGATGWDSLRGLALHTLVSKARNHHSKEKVRSLVDSIFKEKHQTSKKVKSELERMLRRDEGK